MHDIDRSFMEYNPETELMPEAFEYGEAEWSGETGESGVFSETEEMELAAELLGVASEQELDRFLGGLIQRAGRAVGQFVKLRPARPWVASSRGRLNRRCQTSAQRWAGSGRRKRGPDRWATGFDCWAGFRPGARRAQSGGPGI